MKTEFKQFIKPQVFTPFPTANFKVFMADHITAKKLIGLLIFNYALCILNCFYGILE